MKGYDKNMIPRQYFQELEVEDGLQVGIRYGWKHDIRNVFFFYRTIRSDIYVLVSPLSTALLELLQIL